MRLRQLNEDCMALSADTSAKRESKRLHSGIKELDEKRPIPDVPLLPDQLIQPVVGRHAVALAVHIRAVILERARAIQNDAESHWCAVRSRTEHEMQLACVEPEDDLAGGRRQGGGLLADAPFAAG